MKEFNDCLRSPLSRDGGRWIDNLHDSIGLGDYWFSELDLWYTLRWFLKELNEEQKKSVFNTLQRAFPIIKLDISEKEKNEKVL